MHKRDNVTRRNPAVKFVPKRLRAFANAWVRAQKPSLGTTMWAGKAPLQVLLRPTRVLSPLLLLLFFFSPRGSQELLPQAPGELPRGEHARLSP